MEMDMTKKCPVVEVNGFIEKGKQFDLDIELPEDEYGEFVFGPLCPDRKYAVDIWVNRVRHVKVCAKCHHKGRCLKGIDMDFCDDKKPCYPCDKRDCLAEANQCENK